MLFKNPSACVSNPSNCKKALALSLLSALNVAFSQQSCRYKIAAVALSTHCVMVPSTDASSCIASFGSDSMLLHDDKFDTQVAILSRQAQDVNDG